MSDVVVCNCTGITKEQIIAEVKAGAKTVTDISDKTNAGTVCEACVSDIKDIIEENK